MSGTTAWVVGSLAVTTAVQYDQANNAKHKGKLAMEEQTRLAEADMAQKEELARQQNEYAARSAALAEQQAAEVRARAEEAKKEAADAAKQNAIQKTTQTNLDQARQRANELAAASAKDSTTQSPDVAVAGTDETAPAARKRKSFSTAGPAVRI